MLVQDYDLLQILAQVLEIDPASKALVDEVVGIFKYLTHYAPDHRLSTLERYGRHLSQLPLIITSDRTCERLSAIYRNLALTPSVRLVMAEHSHVLTALIQMCSQSRGNHKTIRNVLSTLESLGMDADSCMLLLLHSDGVILNLLLHFLSFSNDEVVRRRSARALRLLARDKAVPILLQYTNVLQALFSAATGDDSLDVRREAASAYTSCASKVPSEMTTIHKQVLESLTELAQGPAYESVALAFKHQAEISQNRTSLVANEDFLIQVSAIALRHDVGTLAKEYIVSALERLSGDVTVRHALVMPHILTVLVQNASVPGAVQALLQLASISPDTRKRLVTHRGLLQALISFTATCADHGDKENVKNTMLLLIPAL
jgi:BMFP domain-containing protein YqiC